jgi:anaerobic ribonucleoside-triphosphate reductase
MASQKLQCTDGERTRCEVWTRVMGYFRPVSFFNTGKKSEHYSRKHFQECVAANESFNDKYAD